MANSIQDEKLSLLEKNIKIIETKAHVLSLMNEEYELKMNLYESFIEFKLSPKNIILSFYYLERFEFQAINKLLFTFFNNIKEAFDFYDKVLYQQKVKLIRINDTINLTMKNIINLDKEVETNLELKKIKLTKDDLINILLNEVNELKKNNQKKELINDINSINEDINKKMDDLKNEINKDIQKILTKKLNELKKEYETKINAIEKNYEKKINELKQNQELKINLIKNDYNKNINEFKSLSENQITELKKESKILIEEYNRKEKKLNLEFNDNVNLINNFKCKNITNMKNINTIANNLNINFMKSVAVYKIIKNDEILYEIAYSDNKNGYNIIIYNIIFNKITNQINNAHSNNIWRIKH